MSNPYDKILKGDFSCDGMGKGNRLAHGLYDLQYNEAQKPKFGRLFLYASLIFGAWFFARKLALDDPVIELALEQSRQEEERRQRMKDLGLNLPASFDL